MNTAADPNASAVAVTDEPPARVGRGLTLAVMAFVLVFAVAGYVWRGNFAGWAAGPGAPGEDAAAAAQVAQFEGMVAKLAERLKTNPDDAEGWMMLGRSYVVLGRHAEAVPAYERAVALRPTDAQPLIDLADAMAMRNGRDLKGEPEQLIAKAYALDPKNLKVLALAGTVAFQREQYAQAVKHWEVAVALAEPGSELATNLQGGIAEARQRGGLGGAPATAPVAKSDAAPKAGGRADAPAAAGAVSGRVTLSAALRAKASPEDTVFIFARPAQGAKMPLAILKRQVKELPLDFTLDDKLAMSPAARISAAGQVIVGARISKSGNAMPQPGDLQGLSAPVAVGTSGVNVEISEEVK